MGTSVESSRRCRIFVIVNGCSIQVGDLLIKLSFAGTDFTDVLQLLIEILLSIRWRMSGTGLPVRCILSEGLR